MTSDVELKFKISLTIKVEEFPTSTFLFRLFFSISPGSFLMTHGVLVTEVPVIPSFFRQLYGSHRNHGSTPQHSLYQHHGNQRDSDPAELWEGCVFFVFFLNMAGPGVQSLASMDCYLFPGAFCSWGGACWCFHFKDLKIVTLPLFLEPMSCESACTVV